MHTAWLVELISQVCHIVQGNLGNGIDMQVMFRDFFCSLGKLPGFVDAWPLVVMKPISWMEWNLEYIHY